MSRRTGRIGQSILNAAIFILLEVAALNMLTHYGQMQSAWLSRFFISLNAGIWDSMENFRSYLSLKADNEGLAQENFELRQQLRQYQEAGIVQQELLNSVKDDNGAIGHFSFLPARIIRHSDNKQHDYFIVNKGSTDGVKEGDGVITDKGAIGIVQAASENFAYVMAFTNSRFTVSCRIGRNGPTGPMKWKGIKEDEGLLSDIPCHINLAPADTVFTSGYSSIFPSDIPLGTTGEMAIVNGATFDITVNMFEDISRLRYVTIVSNLLSEEIGQFEKQQ